MRKILFIILFLNTLIYAKIAVIVSILPEVTFVKKIGGDKVDISLMVKPGNSPHTYEPKPSQMRNISKADLYLSIGVEFENIWLRKFQNINKKMLIKDISKGIKKYNNNPHIWTTPTNVKKIALNIFHELSNIDTKNKKYYKTNLEKFLDEIDEVDKKIREILKNVKPKSYFMVFHPAWGYFAKEYNLTQLPIEIDGKKPKPKELTKLIKLAKKYRVKAIFTQPEFSDQSAKLIAKELGIEVIKISPLNPNWSKTLLKLANAIGGNN